MSKGDYLRSILHRDWETDSKGRVVCRFTTNRPVVDTIFFVNIIVMKIQFPGWYDETGEYLFNPEVGNTEGTLCFDYSTLQGEDDRGPFVFEDVDFDGKDEILIRRTSPLRNSVHYYEVYKPVGADSCVLLNYPPFNGFYCDRCGWDEVSPEKNTITRYRSGHKMQVFWFHR